MSDSLYVDLFSNASLDLYPNNKVSQFTIKLNQPIQLDGSFEVGLAQLICPPTASAKSDETEPVIIYLSCKPETADDWFHGYVTSNTFPFGNEYQDIYRKAIIREPTETLPKNEFTPASGSFNSEDPRTYQYVIRLSDFDSPEDLVGYLRNIFKGESLSELKEAGLNMDQRARNAAVRDLLKRRVYAEDHPSVAQEGRTQYAFGLYMDDKQRLTFKIRDSDTRIAIPSSLARLFGISAADGQFVIYETPGVYRLSSSSNIDFNAARPSVMAVYSNLVLSHRVGDTSAPLLRVMTLPQSDETPGEFLHFEFQDVHYLPVALKFIQEVHMELRGNAGALIPFKNGITFARLHFRKRRQ